MRWAPIALLAAGVLWPDGHADPPGYEAPFRDETYEQVVDIAEAFAEWGTVSDPAMAYPVAIAVHRESRRWGVDVRLVVGMIRVENPWLKSDTTSHAGAVGILQVMPRWWENHFDECGPDLTSVDDNVCAGVGVIRTYLDRGGDTRRALLSYNGCRGKGACVLYAAKVFKASGISPGDIVLTDKGE